MSQCPCFLTTDTERKRVSHVYFNPLCLVPPKLMFSKQVRPAQSTALMDALPLPLYFPLCSEYFPQHIVSHLFQYSTETEGLLSTSFTKLPVFQKFFSFAFKLITLPTISSFSLWLSSGSFNPSHYTYLLLNQLRH